MTDCNQGINNIGHLKYDSLPIKAILIIILLLNFTQNIRKIYIMIPLYEDFFQTIFFATTI